MKALSIQEPWASFIAHHGKSIETRVLRTSYRGPLLLCASKKPDEGYAGRAFATVEMVGCEPMVAAHEARAQCEVYDRAYAFLFEGLRLIEPLPVKGALGLFDPGVTASDLRFL